LIGDQKLSKKLTNILTRWIEMLEDDQCINATLSERNVRRVEKKKENLR
jgi:hypothetical protein